MDNDKFLQICKILKTKYKTLNPFQLCKILGIQVVEVPLVEIRGFCHNILNCNVIYIDANLSNDQKRFVCAHELAHLLFHYNKKALILASNSFVLPTKLEAEANLFAEILLSNL